MQLIRAGARCIADGLTWNPDVTSRRLAVEVGGRRSQWWTGCARRVCRCLRFSCCRSCAQPRAREAAFRERRRPAAPPLSSRADTQWNSCRSRGQRDSGR